MRRAADRKTDRSINPYGVVLVHYNGSDNPPHEDSHNMKRIAILQPTVLTTTAAPH